MLSVILFITPACTASREHDYGVFLGINEEEADKLKNYRTVVIEPSEFSAEAIAGLHDDGKRVYGYLNIGALENYRPYHDRFKALCLGIYEDWPDESWANVSNPEWQNFIVNDLGKTYSDMGLDGFFLDNADVYYHYPTEDIFQGLCSILKGLQGHGLPLIINGGDSFVSKCIDQGIANQLLDGINQETVFTRINFENRTYGQQVKEETDFFKRYLEKVKDCGLTVSLLEYGASQSLSKEIDAYCSSKGFIWYNAHDLELR